MELTHQTSNDPLGDTTTTVSPIPDPPIPHPPPSLIPHPSPREAGLREAGLREAGLRVWVRIGGGGHSSCCVPLCTVWRLMSSDPVITASLFWWGPNNYCVPYVNWLTGQCQCMSFREILIILFSSKGCQCMSFREILIILLFSSKGSIFAYIFSNLHKMQIWVGGWVEKIRLCKLHGEK